MPYCNEVINEKKYSPDGSGLLQSLRIGPLVPNFLTLADKQYMNNCRYAYIATRFRSCISSEYRYTYAAYHFQMLRNQPPFELCCVTMFGAWQHQKL